MFFEKGERRIQLYILLTYPLRSVQWNVQKQVHFFFDILFYFTMLLQSQLWLVTDVNNCLFIYLVLVVD